MKHGTHPSSSSERGDSETPQKSLTFIKGSMSGLASGITKLVVGHPFDTIKVRMQIEGGNGRFNGLIDCVLQTAKKEGIRGFYKGATPPLIGWGISDSVMWGSLRVCQGLIQTNNTPLNIYQHTLAGVGAGIASCVVVTPIEQVKARLQVQYSEPNTKRYTGPIDCVKQLVRNNGILGLYRGFAGTLLFRLFMGIYFGSYQLYHKLLLPYNMSGTTKNFLSGGFASTTLWVIAFPADVIKNRMMAQPDVKPRRYESLAACARHIYQVDKMKGFYRGFVPCLLRSFPTNGAAFVVAEMVATRMK